MKWLTHYLTSSIGRKVTMSLTGLFLILFLVVHLLGNLQLLLSDSGESFNKYAYFLTHFLPVTIIAYGLYAFIILHAIQGLLLWRANRKSKGTTYLVKTASPYTTWSSRQMALLGTLILAFLFIHMGDFWAKVKLHQLDLKTYANYNNGEGIEDLYARVSAAFHNPLIVFAYLIGQIVLSFHLWHGFQSAFQTLGINHPKYTPLIKGLGRFYSIVVPGLFALIPVYMFLNK